jgi:hypothetical protein
MTTTLVTTMSEDQKRAVCGADMSADTLQSLVDLGLVRKDDRQSLTRLGIDVRAELVQRGY